jgi:hypothetical protein
MMHPLRTLKFKIADLDHEDGSPGRWQLAGVGGLRTIEVSMELQIPHCQ